MIGTLNKYYSSVKIEEDAMGGACGTYGDEGKIIHDSGGET
jgi:hypothetical protein